MSYLEVLATHISSLVRAKYFYWRGPNFSLLGGRRTLEISPKKKTQNFKAYVWVVGLVGYQTYCMLEMLLKNAGK